MYQKTPPTIRDYSFKGGTLERTIYMLERDENDEAQAKKTGKLN